MSRVPLRTGDLAVARKLHPTEDLAVTAIIVVLIETTQAHTIMIIEHVPKEDQGTARVSPPPLTGARVAAMITKSLPTNPLSSRTTAAIMTLPNMGLRAGPVAMRRKAMIAVVETEEGMKNNPADTAAEFWHSSLSAVNAPGGGVLG